MSSASFDSCINSRFLHQFFAAPSRLPDNVVKCPPFSRQQPVEPILPYLGPVLYPPGWEGRCDGRQQTFRVQAVAPSVCCPIKESDWILVLRPELKKGQRTKYHQQPLSIAHHRHNTNDRQSIPIPNAPSRVNHCRPPGDPRSRPHSCPQSHLETTH